MPFSVQGRRFHTRRRVARDPFETHLNTARNLGEHPCRLVKAAFEQSLDALLRGQFVDVITGQEWPGAADHRGEG